MQMTFFRLKLIKVPSWYKSIDNIMNRNACVNKHTLSYFMPPNYTKWNLLPTHISLIFSISFQCNVQMSRFLMGWPHVIYPFFLSQKLSVGEQKTSVTCYTAADMKRPPYILLSLLLNSFICNTLSNKKYNM